MQEEKDATRKAEWLVNFIIISLPRTKMDFKKSRAVFPIWAMTHWWVESPCWLDPNLGSPANICAWLAPIWSHSRGWHDGWNVSLEGHGGILGVTVWPTLLASVDLRIAGRSIQKQLQFSDTTSVWPEVASGHFCRPFLGSTEMHHRERSGLQH